MGLWIHKRWTGSHHTEELLCVMKNCLWIEHYGRRDVHSPAEISLESGSIFWVVKLLSYEV